MYARDTDTMGQHAQVQAARRLGCEGRLRVAVEMSEDVRRIAIEGVRRRHPEYDEAQARRVVLGGLYGEALAIAAWGPAPPR